MSTTNRIAMMSVSDLYVVLENGREILVRQTGRMLIEMHRALEWDKLGKEVPPLESWVWCAWWALKQQDDMDVADCAGHLDLADKVVAVDIVLPSKKPITP